MSNYLDKFILEGETIVIMDAQAREDITEIFSEIKELATKHNIEEINVKLNDLEDMINSLSNVARTGNYYDLDNLPNIPSKTSELANDSGFITIASVPTKTSQLSNDSGFITVSSVPTKTSQLSNDSGFITVASVPTKTSQLNNDSGFVNNTYVDNKIITTAIVSGGFIRTDIRTTDGVKYKYDSSQRRPLAITIPHGNGYLADFRIDIPANIQPPNNFYDVNITVVCSGKIVFGAINYFNKNEIVGWVWSPTYDTISDVYIQFSGYGF